MQRVSSCCPPQSLQGVVVFFEFCRFVLDILDVDATQNNNCQVVIDLITPRTPTTLHPTHTAHKTAIHSTRHKTTYHHTTTPRTCTTTPPLILRIMAHTTQHKHITPQHIPPTPHTYFLPFLQCGEGASETAATSKGRQRARKSPNPHSREASVRLSLCLVLLCFSTYWLTRCGWVGWWVVRVPGTSRCAVVVGDHGDPQHNDAVMVFVVLLCCGSTWSSCCCVEHNNTSHFTQVAGA